MSEKNSFEQIIASRLESLGRRNTDEEKLQGFTPDEKKIISYRKRVLSSLVYFIGKDFQMPLELNDAGAGWHWDFENNVVRADPKDLLEKPENFSRFVMGHEAGHRRISRTGFIPLEVWKQPGFAFMMNTIEDPRDNNFVSEGYPQFREDLSSGYEWIEQMEKQSNEKAQAKLGYQPRFKQASYEYIKQWYREITGQKESISENLPDEVKDAVGNTLEDAQNAWWTYPSKQEADKSEDDITRYARASYNIINEKIWPEIQKLIEKDMEDQKMQEFMKDMEKEKMSGSGSGGLPQEMKDKLTPEEQEELEKAIEDAIEKVKKQGEGQEEEGSPEEKPSSAEASEGKEGEGAGKPMPIDMDSLSEGLKQKIKDFVEGLPEEKKKKLSEKAEKELGEFSKEAADDLQGKMTENPEQKDKRAEKESLEKRDSIEEDKKDNKPKKQPLVDTRIEESREVKKFREQAAKELKKDANIYEAKRREVLPIIEKLENDLREIFVKRRAGQWDTGFKYGKRIDIKKRIQEKAKGVSAVESRSWQKREAPGEKDYAITILNDLSGSMQGEKINMDFKAKIVLAEVLNKLSIKCEILGFNDRIYEYQKFDQPMSNDIREKMGGMIGEVSDAGEEHKKWLKKYERGEATGEDLQKIKLEKAEYNDDGWALEKASERLARIRANQKFLIVLSDGYPAESPQHSGDEYDLNAVVKKITENTNQKLIGLGILTDSVSNYYPNYIENVGLEEMLEKLADLIRDIVVNYDKF